MCLLIDENHPENQPSGTTGEEKQAGHVGKPTPASTGNHERAVRAPGAHERRQHQRQGSHLRETRGPGGTHRVRGRGPWLVPAEKSQETLCPQSGDRKPRGRGQSQAERVLTPEAPAAAAAGAPWESGRRFWPLPAALLKPQRGSEPCFSTWKSSEEPVPLPAGPPSRVPGARPAFLRGSLRCLGPCPLRGPAPQKGLPRPGPHWCPAEAP